MKPVTSYQSFDGTIFETAEKCAKYESHCIKIASIVDKLPKFTKDREFYELRSYYQHDPQLVIDVRTEFLMYMDSIYHDPSLRLQLGERCLVMPTGRFIDFFKSKNDVPATLAWLYIGSIDNYFRQWSHPSSKHDDITGQKCINP
ncbi:MAG: hypothetical protein KAS32_31520 [Candidatus Peribacteraceae bacterium]|nr:hypothetical protein [Candidatus Peribacteraceae bacterium]